MRWSGFIRTCRVMAKNDKCKDALTDTAYSWTVVSVRERRAGEVPFEEASRYLWPSPDANNVPGPDSLVARIQIDEEYHPHAELEDLRTGKTVRLLDAWAFLPHWSPDGKYIGCGVWKSAGQNGELTVVDVSTRTILLDPEVRALGTTMKWSPDSRTIAAAGVIYARPRTMLYTVSVPEGDVTILDTLDNLCPISDMIREPLFQRHDLSIPRV